jgi:hypothetical protein
MRLHDSRLSSTLCHEDSVSLGMLDFRCGLMHGCCHQLVWFLRHLRSSLRSAVLGCSSLNLPARLVSLLLLPCASALMNRSSFLIGGAVLYGRTLLPASKVIGRKFYGGMFVVSDAKFSYHGSDIGLHTDCRIPQWSLKSRQAGLIKRCLWFSEEVRHHVLS